MQLSVKLWFDDVVQQRETRAQQKNQWELHKGISLFKMHKAAKLLGNSFL